MGAVATIGSLLTGGALNGVNGLIDRIRGKSPEDAAKLAEIAARYPSEVMQADLAKMQTVNETMRAEAASTHFMQWAWRPTIGFTLAALIVNNYILLPYFQGFGIKPLDIPEKVWEVMLAVVGVSALTRGAEKAIQVWNGGGNKSAS